MKKYLIICENRESLIKLNDYIAVNSLFTEGETITDTKIYWGRSYTDDDRIYISVCAYIQEGGEGVKIYNLREFDFVKENIELCKDDEGCTQIRRLPPNVYRVVMDEDSITVNGYKMKVKIIRDYTYKLMKTYVGTTSTEDLARFIQDECRRHYAGPKVLCEHVIAHGKKCA